MCRTQLQRSYQNKAKLTLMLELAYFYLFKGKLGFRRSLKLSTLNYLHHGSHDGAKVSNEPPAK